MKVIPFDESFTLENVLITDELIAQGYITLQNTPEIDSIKINIDQELNIVWPQYIVLEIDDDNWSLFPECEIGSFIITWRSMGLSSSSECYVPDAIFSLNGTLYNVLYSNVGNLLQIQYVISN